METSGKVVDVKPGKLFIEAYACDDNGDVDVVEVAMLDSDHAAKFSKPWLCQHKDGRVFEFDTENDACAYQSEHREKNGLDAVTGEPTARKVAEWPSEYSEKAVREGWDIWDSEGSDNGHWQVQRIDDPSAFVEATGFAPPKLVSDDDAFRIVANGNQPHHIAAREFLKTHNPKEYHSVMGFAERKLADLYTVDGQIITTGKFSGFKLVAQSAFGVKTDIVNVYSRNGRCIGYVTEGDVDGFIAGNGKVMTPEGGWPVKWSIELIDLFDLRKSAAYQTALAALGSSNRNLASIDDVSPRKLVEPTKPLLMDDARWVMAFLRGIEAQGRHAPTETMQRLIDAIDAMQVTPRIVIGVEGGLIQGATANVPIEYLVYDYDIEDADDGNVAVRPALDGGEVDVIDSGVRIPVIDAAIIDKVFGAAELSMSPSPTM